ncbi:MAG TPA: glycine cleavage T C-terminal barrel domain-containing protein [Candidatus Limnocylindrales bacterium]|nr:glycine cleavage T C-terminal barrel domain-containing protein [Candidatus Limnocylindrales bacterium]
MTDGRIVVDGAAVPFVEGDSVAVAIVRTGAVPGRGGCLCLAGDCGNCLAEVDGVAYVRTCQVAARPGTVVRRHPPSGKPPLPVVDGWDVTRTPTVAEVPLRRVHASTAVVGSAKEAGAAAGPDPLVLDAADGNEVMGIYPGPSIVARAPTGMLHVLADEIVVATGAAEIQPICPGNDLAGIVTAGAAERLTEAGIDLGRVARVGRELVRFEGDGHGRIAAVVTRGPDGGEVTTECDTAVVDLGRSRRDVLARMSPDGRVRAAGPAAEDFPLPAPPTAADAVVCACMGTTVADLDAAWAKGYTDLELLKRASWAGLGPCQGGACLPHVRAFIADRTGTIPEPFTARPAARQITLAEAAADTTVDAFRRTPLHDEHLALGARMDRFGGWWRPWHYGDVVGEYWAVREGVSIGDVSTLGKLVVSGPDVVEALERIYPCRVEDIKPGRSRYALLLNERGHVMDDGMILRDAETRFTLSFTSGGAANAEMWLRDWIETWGLRVHVMDRTMSLAAINVTGPFAGELLRRLGLTDTPRFLSHVRADIAGVPCHVMRLSFTGEAAFELHHPLDGSVTLWRALLAAGQDLGIRPHGLKALFGCRLEKGHVIIGMDTELDTTPRRLGMDWAVRMEKPAFIGRASLERTAKLPETRRWMGFTMDGEAPPEGTPIRSLDDGEIVGNVTASWTSPLFGRALMLGWQRRTPFADRVSIDGREAAVTPTPFYDPEGVRARA